MSKGIESGNWSDEDELAETYSRRKGFAYGRAGRPVQQARLLLAARPGEVAEVGYRVGYDSPSQFSREYRRQFGTPPSQDAVRLRGSGYSPGCRPSSASCSICTCSWCSCASSRQARLCSRWA